MAETEGNRGQQRDNAEIIENIENNEDQQMELADPQAINDQQHLNNIILPENLDIGINED
jgi:hypothetical protein